MYVHGDIRHLENEALMIDQCPKVHGDIRHLENFNVKKDKLSLSSWRHTPFRKFNYVASNRI